MAVTAKAARRRAAASKGAGEAKATDEKARAETKVEESKQTAREAGLRYVSDDTPGIRRVRAGSKFKYVDPDGKPIKDENDLGRIRAMAIPPAWTDVWICPNPQGHIQAVGRDARGRKQYRYHARWREVRDDNKYGKMLAFAQALPEIRARTRKDLALPGLPRAKVLAALVQIMEKTLIRVGNDEYARQNDSFGLTTLRDRHARRVNGKTVTFKFNGKSGVKHEIDLEDPKLAEIVRRCQDLPGEELFQYVDEDDKVVDVGSSDVNDYLREIAGDEFTAKDFRTWAGTILAAQALAELKACDSKAEAKRNVMKAVEEVAKQLGNTKAVCRKCYIHPEVLSAYNDRDMIDTVRKRAANMARSMGKLKPEEASVLSLLRRRLARAKK